MIIQCIKCSTRFRFDESLMEGDGVWVRCSCCREVFFQENPVKAEPEEKAVAVVDRSATLEEPDTGGSPDFDKTLDLSGNKEEIDAILAKIEETKKTLKEHHQPEIFIDIEKGISREEAIEPDVIEEMHKPAVMEDKEFETVDLEETSPSEKPVKRGFWKPWRIIVLIVFINLLFGGLYVWLSPGMSNQVISVLSSTFPMLGDFLGTEKKPVEFHLNSIQLQNVRQRFVDNITAGQLRIVEGIAFNSSPYPVTRIQVKGELYDSNGVIITERLAYGGNLLTDDELATWSEEAMQKELDLPMGSDSHNIRVEPKGQISFMIIFPHEPPGVATAKVSTAGGEKLLK